MPSDESMRVPSRSQMRSFLLNIFTSID
jgi:hypothetical protein